MHIPVLLHEVLEALNPQPGQFVIDGTLGGGGHAKELIKRIDPGGTLLAVDRDPRAVAEFKHSYTAPAPVTVIAEASSYAQLPDLLAKHQLPKADGLLLDLGFSSEQIAGGSLAGRGFSFNVDEPLLMTYSDESPSVAQLLAELSEEDLTAIIREYGEERYAQPIAKNILHIAKREGIATTGQLAAAIRSAVPASYEHGRLNPATRTFQALRIYANSELHQLELLLQELSQLVCSGGRVAIISFHSLEDRIVKQYFRQLRVRDGSSVGGGEQNRRAPAGELPNSIPASQKLREGGSAPKKADKLAMKRDVYTGATVITASEAEIKGNARSRSAKLRVFTMP